MYRLGGALGLDGFTFSASVDAVDLVATLVDPSHVLANVDTFVSVAAVATVDVSISSVGAFAALAFLAFGGRGIGAYWFIIDG